MSFYIKIDNPDAGRPAGGGAPIPGSPVEGSKKVCLVTAFTSVVGAANPPYPADRLWAGKNQTWVAVSLADHGTVTLPFSADEFEEIVTEAQRRGRIADFSSDHWADLPDDLVAIRNRPPAADNADRYAAPPPPVMGLLEATPQDRAKMRTWLMSRNNRSP
jgi:hypothetical protein